MPEATLGGSEQSSSSPPDLASPRGAFQTLLRMLATGPLIQPFMGQVTRLLDGDRVSTRWGRWNIRQMRAGTIDDKTRFSRIFKKLLRETKSIVFCVANFTPSSYLHDVRLQRPSGCAPPVGHPLQVRHLSAAGAVAAGAAGGRGGGGGGAVHGDEEVDRVVVAAHALVLGKERRGENGNVKRHISS